jgi:hypothetical protein
MTADGLSPDYEAKPDMKAENPKDVTLIAEACFV